MCLNQCYDLLLSACRRLGLQRFKILTAIASVLSIVRDTGTQRTMVCTTNLGLNRYRKM